MHTELLILRIKEDENLVEYHDNKKLLPIDQNEPIATRAMSYCCHTETENQELNSRTMGQLKLHAPLPNQALKFPAQYDKFEIRRAQYVLKDALRVDG